MGDRTNDLTLAEVSQPLPTLQRTLSAGKEGHDVARLQADLRRLGFAAGSIDGVFGKNTTAAVAEYCTSRKLPVPTEVDAALWSDIARAGALAQVDVIEAHARGLETSAGGSHDRGGALQKAAVDLRAQAKPAGKDEEKAAAELLDCAKKWRAAADAWSLAAQQIAPYWDPEGRGFKAYARHLRALDHARSHGIRVVNSLVLAGKDYDALGGTDHSDRLAAATIVGRGLAAH